MNETGMKKAAIITSTILLIITSLPVILALGDGMTIYHPTVVGMFLYPTIGGSVGAVLIVTTYIFSFNKTGRS